MDILELDPSADGLDSLILDIKNSSGQNNQGQKRQGNQSSKTSKLLWQEA